MTIALEINENHMGFVLGNIVHLAMNQFIAGKYREGEFFFYVHSLTLLK